MSRALDDLKPWFRPKAVAFSKAAAAAGIAILIHFTFRSIEEQDALYLHGRSIPGDILTNAAGGHSPHNFGLAFDAIPIDLHDQPIWTTPSSVWKQLYIIAEKCGLDALGDPWGEFLSFDKGHFQEPGWRVVQDE